MDDGLAAFLHFRKCDLEFRVHIGYLHSLSGTENATQAQGSAEPEVSLLASDEACLRNVMYRIVITELHD